jgi:8-amino-3,8-dideoxy-alpha-D-manno-octulosonate transaminase
LKAQGILPGNFYWFDNNWHYVRKWDHLKEVKALARLSPEQTAALQKLQMQDFAASDAIISRCISTAISLLWTEEQIAEKGAKMVAAIQKVLKASQVTA